LDNLGKDIRTIASGVVGDGDSAEVYAVKNMNETDQNLDEIILTKFRKLSPERQQQFLNYIDFLIWQDNKRELNNSDESVKLKIKNDDKS
jgi:hypothetical protein